MKLKMQPGAETVTHGTQGWKVNNGSWIVEVPDEVGNFMLSDGRSGCVLVEDPPGEGEIIACPCCHFSWRVEKVAPAPVSPETNAGAEE